MGAPQIIAESLEELMNDLNAHRRAIDLAERERIEDNRRQLRVECHKAFERGRKVGYDSGVEAGRKLTQDERDAIYAEGFAEGAALASKRGDR